VTFPIAYTVKMDLSGTAFGGSPSWTDVTSRVLPNKAAGRVTDGRQDESSDVNPGTFTFTLDNRDAAFTPGNASSTYYPHVKAGVRVRLEITVNATTIKYFDGYADSFETYLDSDRAWGLCDVTATDLLGRLGRTVPLRSILTEEMLLSGPQVYVPMTDFQTVWGLIDFPIPLVVRPGISGFTFLDIGTGLSEHQFGASGPVGAPEGGLTFSDYSPSDGVGYQHSTTSANAPVLGATAFCASVWFRNAVAITGRPLILQTANNEVLGVDVSLSGNTMVVKSFVGSTLSTGTSGSFHKNTQHQIGVEVTATGSGPYTVTCAVIIDGTVLETTSASLTSNKIQYAQIGGQAHYGPPTVYGHFMPGDYAHFALWTSPPSWTDLYSAGHDGFAGEDTPTHATRLLSYRAPSVTLVTSGTYDGTVGLHEFDGESLQTALFDTAHVEAAPLYADGQGRIVLMNRGEVTTPSTAVTLDASDGDLLPTLRVRTDNQYLVNDYTITPSSGAAQRVQDATSQTDYGYFSNSVSAPFDDESDALSVATALVAALKDPEIGASGLDIDLFALAQHDPALVASLLAVRTGKKASLTNLPSPFDAIDVMVQGRDFTFTLETALLTLNTTGLGVAGAATPTGAS
jgi:hypothetical protein